MAGQRVRCVECGCEYTITHRRHTIVQNRVCPSCSHAGWQAIAPLTNRRPARTGVPVRPATGARTRFADMEKADKASLAGRPPKER